MKAVFVEAAEVAEIAAPARHEVIAVRECHADVVKPGEAVSQDAVFAASRFEDALRIPVSS